MAVVATIRNELGHQIVINEVAPGNWRVWNQALRSGDLEQPYRHYCGDVSLSPEAPGVYRLHNIPAYHGNPTFATLTEAALALDRIRREELARGR